MIQVIRSDDESIRIALSGKTVEIIESLDGKGLLIRTRDGLIGIEPLRPDFIKVSIK